MVYARTKMLLQDNCFPKDPGDVTLRYVGPHTPKLYQRFYDILKSVMNVPDSAIQEERFNWGKGVTEKYKVSWFVHKDVDQFTYIYFKIAISAEGDEKVGNANITIKPYLRTEYPQDTLWQRSLFYEFLRTFWHRMFYHKRREEYNEECKHLAIMMQRQLHELFRELRETK
jgi:hypothetical protein